MAMPETERTRIGKILCEKFPESPSRTLAKRLAEEVGCTVDQGRDVIRRIRGNYGNKHRKYAKVPRPNGKAGTKLKCPPSQAESWEPFRLGNDIKVGVLSDIHFPYHSEVALIPAVEYVRKFKPDVLVLNGDIGDFYAVSRFQKNPKKRDLKNELICLREGLAWLRQEFKGARMVYKLGNHDERWNHYLWNHAPEISDMAEMTLGQWVHADKHGIEMVEDQRPIMAGDLPILHGHEFGKSGIAAPVNPARGAFLRTIHSVLIGHLHRTSTHVEPDMWQREIACWSTGCLCQLRPEYQRIGKANWGFATVEVDKKAGFNLQNLRISNKGEVRRA